MDILLHFMACFVITILTYTFVLASKIIKIDRSLSETHKRYWVDRYAGESFVIAAVVGILAGVGKEVWDVFYSDPQLHDLIADAIGVVIALIVLNKSEKGLIGGVDVE